MALWGKLIAYPALLLVLAVVLAPPLIDRVWAGAKATGECRVLRILDADRFRLDCEVIGRQTAQLLGADAPASTGVGCRAEFWQGYRAKWATRQFLWSASEVDVRIDGFGWRDRTLMIVQADGEGLARHLRAAGLALADDGYSVTGWCGGRLEELQARGDTPEAEGGDG